MEKHKPFLTDNTQPVIVKVVEIKLLTSSMAKRSIARLVLIDEQIELMSLIPNGWNIVRPLLDRGCYNTANQHLTLADGEQFLTHLQHTVRGSRIWATPVFELSQQEAIRGVVDE